MNEAQNKIQKRISYLPSTQQVALWVIFRMPRADKDDFKFFSHEFAGQFKRFTNNLVKENPRNYGRFMGGILSGLSRNSILKRLSGGRSKLWTLSDEVKENFEEYKKYLLEVKVYWT